MSITIQIPPEIEEALRTQVPNLDEATREQFLISNYEAARLSIGDIAEILGFETRGEVHAWLAQRHVPMNYSVSDLEEDRENMQRLFGER